MQTKLTTVLEQLSWIHNSGTTYYWDIPQRTPRRMQTDGANSHAPPNILKVVKSCSKTIWHRLLNLYIRSSPSGQSKLTCAKLKLPLSFDLKQNVVMNPFSYLFAPIHPLHYCHLVATVVCLTRSLKAGLIPLDCGTPGI